MKLDDFADATGGDTIGAEAINKIKLDLEPLPFVTDPLESLYPRGPDALACRARAGGRTDISVLARCTFWLECVRTRAAIAADRFGFG